MNNGWHALLGAFSIIPILGSVASILATGIAVAALRMTTTFGWKAAFLLLALAAPLLLVTTVLTAAFLPSVLDLMGVWTDNCDPIHMHHPHLCPLHPSAPIGGPALWICAVGALWGTLIVRAARRSASRMLRGREFDSRIMPAEDLPTDQRMVLNMAIEGINVPVLLVRSPLPLAALAGIRSPRILLSTTLLEMMPQDELRAVLQHENAHFERRDLILEGLVNILAACHPPGLGTRLQRLFQEYVEAACDERAANVLGSGLPGASALLRLHRWALVARRSMEMPTGIAMGITGDGSSSVVENRIQGLLGWSAGIKPPVPFSMRVWGPAAVAAVLALTLSETIHHLLEDLLGRLSG